MSSATGWQARRHATAVAAASVGAAPGRPHARIATGAHRVPSLLTRCRARPGPPPTGRTAPRRPGRRPLSGPPCTAGAQGASDCSWGADKRAVQPHAVHDPEPGARVVLGMAPTLQAVPPSGPAGRAPLRAPGRWSRPHGWPGDCAWRAPAPTAPPARAAAPARGSPRRSGRRPPRAGLQGRAPTPGQLLDGSGALPPPRAASTSSFSKAATGTRPSPDARISCR